MIADVDVVIASGEIITSEVAYGDIVTASCVVERSATVGCVAVAAAAEERVSASGRILIAAVEYKGSSANTGVEAAGGKALKRKPTNRCVVTAASEIKQRALSFRGIAARIAAVRRWSNCLGCQRKPKAGDRENGRREIAMTWAPALLASRHRIAPRTISSRHFRTSSARR